MESTYWNQTGKLQTLHDQLVELIPAYGPVQKPRKNKALEKFRKASNCYYDLYNNDLINRTKEFREVFHIKSSHYRYNVGYKQSFGKELFERTERVLDELVHNAAIEQKLIEEEF